jgi:hypothetical protein
MAMARVGAARIAVRSMSAMPLKAPQERTSQKVREGPEAEIIQFALTVENAAQSTKSHPLH